MLHDKTGARKNAPGKMPPGKVPPRKLPPGKKLLGEIVPRKIAPQKIAPKENCPLPQKCFVKLLHVMEYLSGKNFVNFDFNQSEFS